MVRNNDGFEIAEVDLKLRGPGDMAGTQQSGVVDLHLADLAKDSQLLQYARVAAIDVLDKDPELELPDNKVIRSQFVVLNKGRLNWSRIS